MNKYSIDTKSNIPIPSAFRKEFKQGPMLTHDLTKDFESFALLFIQNQDRQGRMGQGRQLSLFPLFSMRGE